MVEENTSFNYSHIQPGPETKFGCGTRRTLSPGEAKQWDLATKLFSCLLSNRKQGLGRSNTA
jgi:hypothetical protein